MTFIGIDGGGTKTAGVLVDDEGRTLARQQAGSTNFNAVGPDLARRHLAELIAALLADGDLAPTMVRGVGLGMSGVGRTEDRARVAGWMDAILPGVPCFVDNDAVIALAAATGGTLYGVVIVSGTGMIVVGIDAAGRRRRAGGWGPLIGEPGGGFAIGAAGLKAVADAADAISPATALTAALLHHVQVASPEGLVAWAYRDVTWARFAALAPVVVRCAEQGDATAAQILVDAAAALARAAAAVVQGLDLAAQSFPFVLTGGNLQAGPLVTLVTPHLRAIAPAAAIVSPQVEAAVGAALLARNTIIKGI